MGYFSFLKEIGKANFIAPKKPFKLNFAVTYNCNSQCKTCNIWKKTGKQELSVTEIGKIFQNAPFLQWISLTGGEPFLRNDLDEIARAAEKNCNLFVLTIPTNGMLSKKIYKKTKEICSLGIPKTAVSVSIDGSRELHDEIRGMKNSWKKGMKSFEMLKSLESEFENFNALIEHTISPFNISSFEETLNCLNKEGVGLDDLHFTFMHFSNHYYENRRLQKKQEEFKRELAVKINKIKKSKKNALRTDSILRSAYLSLLNPELKSSVKCCAGKASCFLDSYGNVYPCILMDKKLGNLKNYEWNLKKLISMQRMGLWTEQCSGCWIPCEAYQAMLCNIPKTALLCVKERLKPEKHN